MKIITTMESYPDGTVFYVQNNGDFGFYFVSDNLKIGSPPAEEYRKITESEFLSLVEESREAGRAEFLAMQEKIEQEEIDFVIKQDRDYEIIAEKLGKEVAEALKSSHPHAAYREQYRQKHAEKIERLQKSTAKSAKRAAKNNGN